ncbi:MAG: EAL domain-containing protein [Gammaproteobacteria bacterium]|nr:EAL domain-containing protein [Gammaproteobacteria bacterium]
MSGSLRVLLVEDSEDDAALTLRQLKKGGYELSSQRVDTPGDMRAALEARDWDIILCDYNMPEFSGSAALSLLHAVERDIPFIVISGAIGEETAVEMMRSGAHDYIMKDNLARLVAAIERELREAKVRRARCRAEADLRLAARVFESSVEGVMITDSKAKILRVNQAFIDITGYSEEEAVGQRPAILQSGRHSKDFYKFMWASITERGFWQGEVWNRRKSGEVFPEWLTISAVCNAAGEVSNYIGGFTDLSRQKEAENRIQHLMYYDALTDLPNKALFHDRFRQSMLRARRDARQVAVLHLDLDRFTNINDTLGHRTGDQMLQQVARRLVSCVRPRDIVARFGGDEFHVALTDLRCGSEVDMQVQNLIAAFSEPFRAAEREIFIVPSVGGVMFPDDSGDFDELVKFADIALHAAKRQGGTSYEFYNASMNDDAVDWLSTESALRRALQREEFRLHYQPQVALDTGKVIGVEALLRWQRADVGMVMPEQFISILEETRLIVPVGEWVLRQACADQQTWAAAGFEPLPVSVNLSARQFRDKGLVDMISSTLEKGGTNPRLIELEITESCAMEDPEFTMQTLRRCHEMGFRIAIDDFGTGYSSLSYLKRFPLDVLKIDRSFVADLPGDDDDAAIVDTIIAMAHRLKLNVIAEGVEAEAQVSFLREHGCDNMQGYHLGRPMSCEDFLVWLSKYH